MPPVVALFRNSYNPQLLFLRSEEAGGYSAELYLCYLSRPGCYIPFLVGTARPESDNVNLRVLASAVRRCGRFLLPLRQAVQKWTSSAAGVVLKQCPAGHSAR